MKHFYLFPEFHISYIPFPTGLTGCCKLTKVRYYSLGDSESPPVSFRRISFSQTLPGTPAAHSGRSVQISRGKHLQWLILSSFPTVLPRKGSECCENSINGVDQLCKGEKPQILFYMEKGRDSCYQEKIGEGFDNVQENKKAEHYRLKKSACKCP